MNFNSVAFLLFLPFVVLVHWLLPHRARKFWLLAASYFFYMYWNPLLIVLLLASTAVDYFCGRGMERFS
ncbi:MAG: MBOAT family protein, partial [Clostridia bacterium]|nr:MBOAT family protein [Clostridia bacterium]